MESIVVSVKYYSTGMNYDIPDFDTNLTIFEDGSFTSDGKYAESSTIQSWFYEVFPNGSDGLTIYVNSNIARHYDKWDTQVKGVVEYLEMHLPHLKKKDKFSWPM